MTCSLYILPYTYMHIGYLALYIDMIKLVACEIHFGNNIGFEYIFVNLWIGSFFDLYILCMYTISWRKHFGGGTCALCILKSEFAYWITCIYNLFWET